MWATQKFKVPSTCFVPEPLPWGGRWGTGWVNFLLEASLHKAVGGIHFCRFCCHGKAEPRRGNLCVCVSVCLCPVSLSLCVTLSLCMCVSLSFCLPLMSLPLFFSLYLCLLSVCLSPLLFARSTCLNPNWERKFPSLVLAYSRGVRGVGNPP